MGSTVSGNPLAMQRAFDVSKKQLADLISQTQMALSKSDRQRIMCMITLDAHSRDIIEVLISENALAPTDFQWQSKLRPRFVSEAEREAMAVPHACPSVTAGALFSICDARFDYGFEYLGSGPRLVITPLTDRIYVTATQALHLKMGCAPAGPAGTLMTRSTATVTETNAHCFRSVTTLTFHRYWQD
jgi:dynein heavy chain